MIGIRHLEEYKEKLKMVFYPSRLSAFISGNYLVLFLKFFGFSFAKKGEQNLGTGQVSKTDEFLGGFIFNSKI